METQGNCNAFAKETKVAHALALAFSGQKWSSRVFQVISTFWDRVKLCQDLSTATQLGGCFCASKCHFCEKATQVSWKAEVIKMQRSFLVDDRVLVFTEAGSSTVIQQEMVLLMVCEMSTPGVKATRNNIEDLRMVKVFYFFQFFPRYFIYPLCCSTDQVCTMSTLVFKIFLAGCCHSPNHRTQSQNWLFSCSMSVCSQRGKISCRQC